MGLMGSQDDDWEEMIAQQERRARDGAREADRNARTGDAVFLALIVAFLVIVFALLAGYRADDGLSVWQIWR